MRENGGMHIGDGVRGRVGQVAGMRVGGGDETWTNGDSHDRIDREYEFWPNLVKPAALSEVR